MTPRHDSDQFRRRSGSDADLLADLRRMDSRPYGSYKSVIGDWDYGDFQLSIDRVQSDPYAPPSAIRAITVPKTMGLPEEALSDGRSRLATADFLARAFDSAIAERARGGAVRIARPGQEILQRSSVTVMPDRVEIRFQVQLPARGRSILGREAARIFDVDVPNIVMDAFDFISEDEATTTKRSALLTHIAVYEDYRALQDILVEKNWVAFVAEGSILARRSGVSQSPMEDAVPFESPESLRRAVTLPHAGEITGMAIEPGVTLIVGGGYHGKSTLLSALQRGVYAHIPGDGRELVATTPDAMKVRAADGRAITAVDVSAFITHLPTGADTRVFSTENASGSTSQAAAIMEAVELGSPLLLIDEDTSATNLLIRDERMRTLVAAEKEPITPLVDRIGALATSGVSTIMVMGGSGDYLDVADRVLMLDSYRCLDVSERAREVVAAMPRRLDDEDAFTMPTHRVLIRQRPNTERPKTKSSGLDEIILDRRSVSLFDLEQIVDPGQTEAIAWAMRTILEELANSQVALPDLLKRFQRRLDSEGLDTVTKAGARAYPAFLARPRMVDIGAALNRYRGLRIQ
ncbi:ABC-ATPase domain-containing protein [Schaalia cardiffensis]|uniref:ABC-ATPase domain-containing protein n=1 Tax=Schaalia cardiffensis TaxID=181487 RepID=UPI0023F41C0C|nr:ABC-ATPase domain-containing protein [Schaalia cardiffensis]